MKKKRNVQKTVVIPKNSGVIEQAEIFADIESRLKKFKKGSDQWQKAKQKYLEERYKHSSVPYINNPGTATIQHAISENFPAIFGENSFLVKRTGFPKDIKNQLDNKTKKATHPYFRELFRFKKALSTLVEQFLEIQFGLKPMDYAFSKNANAIEKERIKRNRRLRWLVEASFLSMLGLLYKINPLDLSSLERNATNDVREEWRRRNQNLTAQNTPQFISDFSKHIQSVLYKSLKP